MTSLDFSKLVNFTPLDQLGVGRADSAKLLVALSPIIDLEFQKRVKNAFNDTEMEEIGKEAESKGIKPEDGMALLEEKYHAKTGNYFMEEMRQLFNEYVVHAANIVEKARQDTQAFADSGEANINKFNELLKEEKFEDAAKLLDDSVKTNRPNTSDNEVAPESKSN